MGLQLRRGGQRMPAPPGDRMVGQFGVEIDVRRTRHVPGKVVGSAVGCRHSPAHIENAQTRIGQPRGKVAGEMRTGDDDVLTGLTLRRWHSRHRRTDQGEVGIRDPEQPEPKPVAPALLVLDEPEAVEEGRIGVSVQSRNSIRRLKGWKPSVICT